MLVTKRSGQTEIFTADKINRRAQLACEGYDGIFGPLTDVAASEIIMKAQMDIYPGIPTRELDQSLINSARGRIQFEPNYSFAAARLLLFTLYEEVMGPSEADMWFAEYGAFFKNNIKVMVEKELLNADLLNFDLDRLAAALQPSRDYHIHYLGVQTLYDRYFIHTAEKKRLELPQAFFMRVAMGLSLKETDREQAAIDFYNKLSAFDALSSTPTLFNAGTLKSQLSSCYLNTFDDSIDGIFDGLWQEARKSKHAGGLGFDMTPLRSRNSYIKGTNGENQGAVFFWKLYNDLLVAVNQGGKRKGAGCAYLETWHGDFEDFLNLRKNTGDERIRTHDMNTANWIPDLFMKQVLNDGPWYLFSPNEAPEFARNLRGRNSKKITGPLRRKRQVLASCAFLKNAAPRICGKKCCVPCLKPATHGSRSKTRPITVTLCNMKASCIPRICALKFWNTPKPSKYVDGVKTEIGETAVCNLASINLAMHVDDAEIDWDKLAATVKSTIRMLDNVIDLNLLPDPGGA